MPKLVSGKKAVKILCRYFGFVFVSQKGSHIKIQKKHGRKVIITIVPNHRELATGTLLGILRLAEVEKKDFLEYT